MADILTQLGVRPVINACGVYTDLGGSILSRRVWEAMEYVNSSFVNMVDLLDQSGKALARMVDAEAARVVPGASAAIALGTAACMTGMDGSYWERLPNTAGMKDEVVIQHLHRYKYDRCARLAGARVVEAGNSTGATLADLSAAFTRQTAAILFPAHLSAIEGTLPLDDVVALGHRKGIPTIVDAAYLNYPTSVMKSFTAAGADLVCFSAKYFGGPNSGGFVCGRKDLIDAVAGLDFTRFESGEYRTFGRAFKMDRQIIVGVVVALQEWLEMDHEKRWQGYQEKVQTIISRLAVYSGLVSRPMHFTMDERLVNGPPNCVAVSCAPASGANVQALSELLAAANPSIATIVLGDNLVISMETILDGQEVEIVQRLESLLKARSDFTNLCAPGQPIFRG